MTTEFAHRLGSTVEDKVTGFRGTLTSATIWLNGCKRYGITPTVDEKGCPRPDEHVDESQIRVISVGDEQVTVDAGGPTRSNPTPV